MNPEIGDRTGDEPAVVLTPLPPPSRGGLRVQQLMFVVGACAIFFWLAVLVGVWLLAPALILVCASVIGMIVILMRRMTTQRESLLWALSIAAGRSLPLADAALAFSEQFGRSFRWRMQVLASLLREGFSLPDALARVPGALSRESEVLIRAGDSSGTLPPALREAASARATRDSAWGETALRLLYLAWIVVSMQVITGFILYFIIPKFEAIFKDFGVSLPPFTVLTIEVSHFIMKYFFVFGPVLFLFEVVIPLALLVGLFNSYALWLDVPLLDSLFRRRHAALVMRSLALVVEGQGPIEPAMRALAEQYPSGWVRDRLTWVDGDVRKGTGWVESLVDHGLLRRADAAVLVAAQKVGNLDWALRELAESSDRRLGYRLRFWLQMLFPVLIVSLGSVVMVFAVAYFSPLVRLIEALSG